MDELGPLFRRLLETLANLGLGKQRNDGDTRVTTNDGDDGVSGVGRLDGRKESGSSDDVKGGDSVQLGGVVLAGVLEDLSDDGYGGVYGV